MLPLKKGDHLKSRRFGIIYAHHGIYLGNGEVIHYSGLSKGLLKGKVIISSLADFCNGNIEGLKIVEHTTPKFNVAERIERAKARLNEDEYSLMFNNCEHFVNYCIEGKEISQQVMRAVGALSIAALAIGTARWLHKNKDSHST